jgi:hypothetical protein
MSGCSQEKFRGGFRIHERFLNNFSVANTFNLIARRSFTPGYKGRDWGAVLLCQHAKIFFKIRQKSTNGLMAFRDKGMGDGFLASK